MDMTDRWNNVVSDYATEAQDDFNEDRGKAKDIGLYGSFRSE